MSSDINHSLSCIFVTAPGGHGLSSETISAMRNEVLDTEPRLSKIISALGFILRDEHHHSETFHRMRERGRYLFGLYPSPAGSGSFTPHADPPEGLFYAEGKGLGRDGAYSTVRLETYISPWRVAQEDLEDHRQSLLKQSLGKVASGRQVYVVPVNRTTRVMPFCGSDGENSRGYLYGYAEELAAVSKLDVPERLRSLLVFQTAAWHRSELKPGNAGEADFADVMDELQDRAF